MYQFISVNLYIKICGPYDASRITKYYLYAKSPMYQIRFHNKRRKTLGMNLSTWKSLTHISCTTFWVEMVSRHSKFQFNHCARSKIAHIVRWCIKYKTQWKEIIAFKCTKFISRSFQYKQSHYVTCIPFLRIRWNRILSFFIYFRQIFIFSSLFVDLMRTVSCRQ